MFLSHLASLRTWMIALSCATLVFTGCKDDDKNDTNNTNNNSNATKYETSSDGKTVRVKDFGNGTGTITWTADKTYILENFVFVNDGQTLTIQPGTVIKGLPGQAANATALIVARGGKINAEGTAEKPIIFTTTEDDIANTNEAVDKQRGRWGGLILLGKARLNTSLNERAIEGIPTTEKRGLYGGTNDDDNSGILRYVSVRHPGSLIGASNEINGITFGAVGRGTTVDHVEVVYSDDDGIELFGGTVNIKYASLAFNQDDNIDYDEGYRGNIQHVFVIQSNEANIGDRGGECDGGLDPVDGKPYATPRLANLTFIGASKDSTRRLGFIFRDNAGGFVHNSILTEWGNGIEIEDLAADKGEDSYNRLKAGDLAFRHNIFWNIGKNTETDFKDVIRRNDVAGKTKVGIPSEAFTPGNNRYSDPGVTISYTNDGRLNPVPTGNVGDADPSITDSWFDKTPYIGAFAPGNNNHWLRGWTFLDTHNYLAK
jgi:hypothetical protein